jgi:hypothetical protein
MFLKEFLQINLANRHYYKVELTKTIECLENQDQLNEFLLDELQTKIFLLMKQKYYPKFKNYSEFHKILAKNDLLHKLTLQQTELIYNEDYSLSYNKHINNDCLNLESSFKILLRKVFLIYVYF